VFWQPGCTSCLRAKEFLTTHGIAFESINVRECPGALEELRTRGIRTIPVIARGESYILGQDLDELSAFVGVGTARQRLEVSVLLQRVDRLLRVAEAATLALPKRSWSLKIPQRDRTYLDLGYHIAMISDAFVDAAGGVTLEFARYELRAPADGQSAAQVACVIETARARIATWALETAVDARATLRTYFGDRSLHTVLERTAWHIAQHCRQLEHIVVEQLGAIPTERLRPEDLEGLPVPRAVWDREITETTA
jgi:glutaredoxin